MLKRLNKNQPWQAQDLGGKRHGVCVVRYGAFGDAIQMSGILPHLRDRYGRVTVNTTPTGYDLLRENPYIDEFFIQENDQVPNPELGDYWEKLGGCFDNLVQLSESVEGSLLAVPGREQYDWSAEARHRAMNVNYQERTHDIAGVSHHFDDARFYPTKREHLWARSERMKMGLANKVVVWTLSGSSVHKAWPYTDHVIARLMMQQGIKVVFVGDHLCKVLEMGWEKEKRVLRRSGKWSIRQTLAFLGYADMVVGPETGVMNAAGMLPVPKVCLLSHSTPENLTKHWSNCTAIEPQHTHCYPCHKMHYGWSTCQRVTGIEVDGALCQANIHPDTVHDAIINHLNEVKVA